VRDFFLNIHDRRSFSLFLFSSVDFEARPSLVHSMHSKTIFQTEPEVDVNNDVEFAPSSVTDMAICKKKKKRGEKNERDTSQHQLLKLLEYVILVYVAVFSTLWQFMHFNGTRRRLHFEPLRLGFLTCDI
jgi:hypothetical protein